MIRSVRLTAPSFERGNSNTSELTGFRYSKWTKITTLLKLKN